jgi:hypothetical protein
MQAVTDIELTEDNVSLDLRLTVMMSSSWYIVFRGSRSIRYIIIVLFWVTFASQPFSAIGVLAVHVGVPRLRLSERARCPSTFSRWRSATRRHSSLESLSSLTSKGVPNCCL